MSGRAGTSKRLADVPRSAAQTRVVTAALGLFARHGVNGTSLQMIADELGVTKAAIYHQFPTKDEIVIAAVEVELVKVEAALDEVLSRFPEWEVDWDHAVQARTSTVRGWESLPVVTD